MAGIKAADLGEGQEEDLNFALILVISPPPLEPAPFDRDLGMEGDEPHSLRKLSK